jgi:hypothetical protein
MDEEVLHQYFEKRKDTTFASLSCSYAKGNVGKMSDCEEYNLQRSSKGNSKEKL